MNIKKLLVLTLLALTLLKVFAASINPDDIVGTWYNQEKTSKIKIYKCGNEGKKYCGRIVWLKRDKEEDGTPRVDKNNPDPKKRKTPLQDLVILKLFVYDSGEKEWNQG